MYLISRSLILEYIICINTGMNYRCRINSKLMKDVL